MWLRSWQLGDRDGEIRCRSLSLPTSNEFERLLMTVNSAALMPLKYSKGEWLRKIKIQGYAGEEQGVSKDSERRGLCSTAACHACRSWVEHWQNTSGCTNLIRAWIIPGQPRQAFKTQPWWPGRTPVFVVVNCRKQAHSKQQVFKLNSSLLETRHTSNVLQITLKNSTFCGKSTHQ